MKKLIYFSGIIIVMVITGFLITACEEEEQDYASVIITNNSTYNIEARLPGHNNNRRETINSGMSKTFTTANKAKVGATYRPLLNIFDDKDLSIAKSIWVPLEYGKTTYFAFTNTDFKD